jgi:hypothetical protein
VSRDELQDSCGLLGRVGANGAARGHAERGRADETRAQKAMVQRAVGRRNSMTRQATDQSVRKPTLCVHDQQTRKSRMGGLSRPPPVGPACVSARVFVGRLPNLPGGWSGVTRAPASMRVARCRCLADGGSRGLRALGSGEQVQRSWSCRCVPSWVQGSASESRSRMTLPIRLPSASRAESTICVPWSPRA